MKVNFERDGSFVVKMLVVIALWWLTVFWAMLFFGLYEPWRVDDFQVDTNDDYSVDLKDVDSEDSHLKKLRSHRNNMLKIDYGDPLPEFKPDIDVEALWSDFTTVFMVMSARSHFAERQAVRDTWAKNRKNVVFVVGNKWCGWPPNLQDVSGPCELLKSKQRVVARSYQVVLHNKKEKALQKRLLEEQNTFGDLLILDMVDSYGNLSAKNLFMLEWIARKMKKIPWVFKVDDDSIISVDRVDELLQSPDMSSFDLIGHLEPHSPVLKEGRWMELQYNDTHFYPTYCQGSTGYIINSELVRKIVAYQQRKPLPIYRCEDAAVGFWAWLHVLKEEGRTPRLHEDPRFVPSTFSRKKPLDSCLDQKYKDARINYGHQLTPSSMRECFEYLSKLPTDPVGLNAPPLEAPEWMRHGVPRSDFFR